MGTNFQRNVGYPTKKGLCSQRHNAPAGMGISPGSLILLKGWEWFLTLLKQVRHMSTPLQRVQEKRGPCIGHWLHWEQNVPTWDTGIWREGGHGKHWKFISGFVFDCCISHHELDIQVSQTFSISDMWPVHFFCSGKSTYTSCLLAITSETTPMLWCDTLPHLYLGVVTLAFTRTLKMFYTINEHISSGHPHSEYVCRNE